MLPLIAMLATTAYGAYSANKAQKTAAEAAKASQVDINKLDEQTRSIARRNALESAELERQLTPEVPQLRTAANNAVLSGLSDNRLSGVGNDIASRMGASFNTPLLQAAIAKARANLDLGGKLGIDQQNLVSRRALENAGSVAPGSLGLGRDLVARDLGISSLDLENSRLAQAAGLGNAELGMEQANAQNYLQQAQTLSSILGQNFGQNLSAAQFGQSIRQPIVGLDPSAIANLTVGNSNANQAALANQANIQGAQSGQYLQLAGNLFGGYLANRGGATPYAKTGGMTGSGYSPAPYNFGGK